MSTSDGNGRPRLFPGPAGDSAAARTTGILPSQQIRDLVAAGRILALDAVSESQIQPASLDLRLGAMAHRVQASFLPGPGNTVEQRIQDLRMARIDLTGAVVFEKGCVYIVPLMEELNLPADISAHANPKSTTGRLDIFTRLITDGGVEFERVPPGYKGRLYAEIVSRTFTIRVRAGMRLSQIRFLRGKPSHSDKAMRSLDQEQPLVYGEEDSPAKAKIDRGLKISVNLRGSEPSEVVAYKAKKNAPVIDLGNIDHYAPEDFWDAAYQPSQGLILDPGDFYILASKEKISVPSECAAEMTPIDPSMGEFRIHYAGFFDPGFGYGASSDIKGTRAVLEVRAHEVPFLVEDGQTVGRLTYLPLIARPDKIYGVNIGSSYQRQALTLSKQFKKALSERTVPDR